MTKAIVCIGGRCSSWGRSWRKHLYAGNDHCLRCGMSHREQWDEDKAAGLVSGEYKPPQPSKPRPLRNPDQIMYCAAGDYGIEYSAPTEAACMRWIKQQGLDNDFDGADYYTIVTHTKAELAAMPEV